MDEPGEGLRVVRVPAALALEPAERHALLGVVFESLRRSLGSDPYVIPSPPAVQSGPLWEPARVFVTVYVDGSLRGCIGLIRASRVLWEAAAEMARAACTRDPRFDRLTGEELDSVEADVSILGDLVEVPAGVRDELPEFLRPGVHGAYLRQGDTSGLLLPQVALTHGWDSEEFLSQTAIKAGLAEGAWRDRSCELSLFRVAVVEGKYGEYGGD